MRYLRQIIIALIAIALIGIFATYKLDFSNNFILLNRLQRLCAIVLVSITIAYSTIVFQTISSNKILTPSLMGYEHLFVFSQVIMLIILGSESNIFRSKSWGFVFAVILMVVYSFLLYIFLFRNKKRNVYFILLIGLVLGIFFNTSTQFLQMTIDPNEYGYIQRAVFASLNKTSTETLLMALVITVLVFLYLFRSFKYLNILSLGRETSFSLGVDYDKIARKQLLGISVLVAVSTALIGPITFVGVFISNISYKLSLTSTHKETIGYGIGITLILLLVAQLSIEHFLNYRHSLSVLINLIGGGYFILLIIKSLKNK